MEVILLYSLFLNLALIIAIIILNWKLKRPLRNVYDGNGNFVTKIR